MTLIDDATRAYLLKSKDEVLHIFQTYHKMIEVKFEKRIKAFRSESGGEYTAIYRGILLKMGSNLKPHVHTHQSIMVLRNVK